ncbi:MAG: zinc ABC transporter substrate-binding protein [Candidatus Marinimicrobia bacterium]|nr:zinc ABC transporter substrate-binding protein [Candidatus Neomarinimicrobiota bacterium]
MKKLLKELEALNLPKDKFAIFGSGPLGIRGIREVNDLDLVVLPELWQELAERYPVKKIKLDPKRYKAFLTKNIEVASKPMLGFEARKMIESADIINGIRFVNLETTIEWKKKAGREVDLRDIKLIKAYLKKNPA